MCNFDQLCGTCRDSLKSILRSGPTVLPRGWVKLWCEDNEKFYYYHEVLGEVTWDPPIAESVSGIMAKKRAALEGQQPAATVPAAKKGRSSAALAKTVHETLRAGLKDLKTISLPAYARPPPSTSVLREVPNGSYALDKNAFCLPEWREGLGRGIMAALLRKPWRFTIKPTVLRYTIPTAAATFCALKNVRYDVHHAVPHHPCAMSELTHCPVCAGTQHRTT